MGGNNGPSMTKIANFKMTGTTRHRKDSLLCHRRHNRMHHTDLGVHLDMDLQMGLDMDLDMDLDMAETESMHPTIR